MKPYHLLLLCTACFWSPNPQHRYHVVYGDGFQAATQRGIVPVVQQATKAWAQASDNFITFTFDNEPGLATITVYANELDQLRTLPSTTNDTIGITYWHGESCDIHLAWDLNDTNLSNRVGIHEFGHAIGLVHTGPDTIMYWNIAGASPVITCADLAQMCNVWNSSHSDPNKTCDPTQMPGCETANVEPDAGAPLFCHLNGIYQPCDPTDYYSVQIGNNDFATCNTDPCEYGQTCMFGGVMGKCESEPQ